MARGQERRLVRHDWWSEPPWWAWVLIAAGLVVIVVGVVIGPRQPAAQSQAELDRITAAIAAEDAKDAAAAASATPQPLSVQRTAGQPLRVLTVGDSLTNGLFATEQSQGFAFQLVDRLGASGPAAEQTAAISGGEAGKVAAITDVPDDLDVAVVELGTNDATRTELGTFSTQYATLLDRIRGSSPDAALLCLGVWGESPDYDQEIRAACEARGGRYVSLTELYKDTSLRGPAGVERFGGKSDDFHPNDAGHTAIADRVWAQLSVAAAG